MSKRKTERCQLMSELAKTLEDKHIPEVELIKLDKKLSPIADSDENVFKVKEDQFSGKRTMLFSDSCRLLHQLT